MHHSAPLEMLFPSVSFLARIEISTEHVEIYTFLAENLVLYNKAFLSISLHTHNSSLEGATELKFAPFCSS